MGRKIFDAISEVELLPVGKRLMLVVGLYLAIVALGTGLFVLWPSSQEYAWIDFKSPGALWLGVSVVVLSFVFIVLYMIFGIRKERG